MTAPIRTAILLSAASTMSVLAIAPVAHAESPAVTCKTGFCVAFTGSDVSIRATPVTGKRNGLGQKGQKFAINNYTCEQGNGGSVHGDGWWDHGTDQATGVTGWVADYYLDEATQGETNQPCN